MQSLEAGNRPVTYILKEEEEEEEIIIIYCCTHVSSYCYYPSWSICTFYKCTVWESN
jgi:hypothetical protein